MPLVTIPSALLTTVSGGVTVITTRPDSEWSAIIPVEASTLPLILGLALVVGAESSPALEIISLLVLPSVGGKGLELESSAWHPSSEVPLAGEFPAQYVQSSAISTQCQIKKST